MTDKGRDNFQRENQAALTRNGDEYSVDPN